MRCAGAGAAWVRRRAGRRLLAVLGAAALVLGLRHRSLRAAAAFEDELCAFDRHAAAASRAASEYGACAVDAGWDDTLVVSVLTMDRPRSLARLLASLREASPGEGGAGPAAGAGAHFRAVDVHVWIDHPRNALAPDPETLAVARSFVWSRGRYVVHVRDSNAGLARQWLEAWRPSEADLRARTVGLIVEDDIALSPHYERFLIGAHRAYAGRPYVAGVSLQPQIVRASDAFAARFRGHGPYLQAPPGHRAFLTRLVGSWGLSPHPRWWRRFLAWVETRRAPGAPKPYVPSLLPTRWFQALEARGRAGSMWTAWYIRFAASRDLFHVFPALPRGLALAVNYRERGEHYDGAGADDGVAFGRPLRRWQDALLPRDNEEGGGGGGGSGAAATLRGGGVGGSGSDSAPPDVFRQDAPHLDWHGFAADAPALGGACVRGEGPAEAANATEGALSPAAAAVVALARARGGGAVGVTLVNAAFLPMARSWLCNLRAAGIPRPPIAWVALDDASARALHDVPDSVVIRLADAVAGAAAADGVDWASLGYWQLMLARTRLLRDVLRQGVDVFVFEVDAVWLRDPWPALTADAVADVVGFATADEIGGGFLRLRASARTRQLLADVALLFEGTFHDLRASCFGRGADDRREIKNDQSFLTDLVRRRRDAYAAGNPVRFSLLDPNQFVDGRWYRGPRGPYGDEAAAPAVINNNWIRGVSAKIERAKRWRHWFLDAQGRCLPREQTIFADSAGPLSRAQPPS